MGAGGSESPVETTFTFQVTGDKLTGTVSSSHGEFEIQDGKVDGDSITFSLVVPGAKILYDGEVVEEGVDFLASFEGRGPYRSLHRQATLPLAERACLQAFKRPN